MNEPSAWFSGLLWMPELRIDRRGWSVVPKKS